MNVTNNVLSFFSFETSPQCIYTNFLKVYELLFLYTVWLERGSTKLITMFHNTKEEMPLNPIFQL